MVADLDQERRQAYSLLERVADRVDEGVSENRDQQQPTAAPEDR